ncbi:MAG: acyl-CoA dehydrogenase family protein [Proteobacteria bacterium]|nr:acyl-CoA dehydrogenase family protein [Pseudomonadota bacterium]
MDFELSEENRIFREAIREFAQREIAPLVEEAEATATYPKQLFRKMGEQGFLCPRFPIEIGGGGGDKITECIMVEEVNYVCAGVASGIVGHTGLATYPLYVHGSDELKENYLYPAARGEKIGAFGLSEPDVGSDAAAIRTRAVRDGDSYILNGTKMFITNGPICDYVVVCAYTDPSKRGAGINLFVVDKGTPGFVVSRKLEKLGNHCSETGELVFEDCRVPASHMIGGKEGGGFEQIASTLLSGRITYGARATGTAQAIYDLTVEYAKQRVQFGKPIVKHQFIRFRLAEVAMLVDIMRQYTWRVAWLFDQGKKVRKESSMAKLFATEMVQKIAGDCIQIFGGYGYMKEYPIERHFRDARLYTVTEGTSEVQRMVIAKECGF